MANYNTEAEKVELLSIYFEAVQAAIYHRGARNLRELAHRLLVSCARGLPVVPITARAGRPFITCRLGPRGGRRKVVRR